MQVKFMKEKIMYQNYLFDLYGTLVDIHTDEQDQKLWEKMAFLYGYYGAMYEPQELRKEYERLCKKEAQEITNVSVPEIDIIKVFRQMYEQKGVQVSLDTIVLTGQMFRITSMEYVKLYDGVIQLLEGLKAKGKKVYLVSNAQRIFTYHEMKYLDILKYFDGITYSSDVAVAKPDVKIYEEVLEKYNLKKEESIMIGNDPTADVLGSKAAGLDSLYIHSNISPELTEEVQATYLVMDGDVTKVMPLILK